jgi:anti-sigma factor RsiW
MSANDPELLIEDYLEGRLQGARRDQFEAQLRTDPELRRKVQTTTGSIDMVRKLLVPVDPGPEFEEKVSSQIVSITQSNPKLQGQRRPGNLTPDDPDAKLLHDPQAVRERRRMVMLAVLAGALFLLAATGIAIALLHLR